MSVESKSRLGKLIQALLGRKPQASLASKPSQPPNLPRGRRAARSSRPALPESCELRDIGSLVL